MTISEFCGIMTAFSKSEGIPFRHYEFTSPTSAPCMVYLEGDGESVYADSLNVLDDVYIRLELYVRPEDSETAAKLEGCLYENGLSYERSRSWVSERHEVMMIYEICI